MKNNQVVKAGTPILRLDDPFLDAQKIATAKVRELKNQHRAYRISDYVRLLLKKHCIAGTELEYILDKDQSMWVKAGKSGKVFLPEADLLGRLIRKGDLLGYVLSDDQGLTVRMAVAQNNIGQLRDHVDSVAVRFASEPDATYTAMITRQAPEATNQIPSDALSIHGGGKFIADPNAANHRTITEKYAVDLA